MYKQRIYCRSALFGISVGPANLLFGPTPHISLLISNILHLTSDITHCTSNTLHITYHISYITYHISHLTSHITHLISSVGPNRHFVYGIMFSFAPPCRVVYCNSMEYLKCGSNSCPGVCMDSQAASQTVYNSLLYSKLLSSTLLYSALL